MKQAILILSMMVCYGCATSKSATRSSFQRPELLNDQAFKVTLLSTDTTYGFTKDNPVLVGGKIEDGPKNERRFLNALAGPNGEYIRYERTGSCCGFKTKNGFMDMGMLDRYKIEWDGQKEPVYLYINMYDPGELKIPSGFTARVQ